MPTINKSSAKRWQPKKKQHERVNNNATLYNSTAWRKDRAAHIRQNPLCVICLSKGIYTPSVVSDHITPINQGGDVWDKRNRQAICLTCHARKSGSEAHQTK